MTAIHFTFMITLTAALVGTAATAATTDVYIGTYTRGASKGIYRLRFDTDAGDFRGKPELVADEKNPEFLAMSPDGKFLYSSDSTRGNPPRPLDGTVDSFAITPGAPSLKLLNRAPCGGDGGTFLLLDHEAQNLFCVAYGAATVAMLPVNADGTLRPPSVVLHHHGSSVNYDRQAEAHPHSITLDPAGTFAFVPDLGCDKIYSYRVDSRAHTLAANDPPFVATPPGSGPRRICFSGDGKFAYAVTEMGRTVLTYAYDAGRGVLTQTQVTPVLNRPANAGDTGSEIALGADDKFLYTSIRGDNSIVVMKRDPASGTVTPLGWQSTLGKVPRHFAIDPTGRWLIAANQNSASIKVLKIDPATGGLSPAPGSAEIDTPVCVLFDRMVR